MSDTAKLFVILSRQKPAKTPIEAEQLKVPELETFISRRDYTGAISLVEFNIANGDQDEYSYLWLGFAAFHLGDYEKARAAFEKLIQLQYPDSNVYLYLSACLFFLGMYEEADKYASMFPGSHSLKNRILFHTSHKFNDESRLLSFHKMLQDTPEDQCTLASIHYLRNHYQEAIEVYKRLLLENKDYVALNVYMAMCYYKLDYFDVSQDLLNTYLSHYPTSIVALNLKSCNIFKLFNGKAAEAELKPLTDQIESYQFGKDLIRHNLSVFKQGEGALGVMRELVGVIPEARLNLILYHLKHDEINEAYTLASEIDPSSPLEYILKGIVNAIVGQQQESKEHLNVAQQFFHLVGSSASECDTISGRQCMASSFIILKQFEDAQLYLDSIQSYFLNDDAFNFNLGQVKLGLAEYEQAEKAFSSIKNQRIIDSYIFKSQLAKCCLFVLIIDIRSGNSSAAWDLYLQMDNNSDSFNMLIFIGNECYKIEDYLIAARSFDVLCHIESSPEFWSGCKGACVGVFKQYLDGNESRENVREILGILRNHNNPEANKIIKHILKIGLDQ